MTKYLRISGRYLLEDLLGKHSTSSQPVNTGKGTRGVFVDGMSMLLKYNFCPTTKSQKLLDKITVYFVFFLIALVWASVLRLFWSIYHRLVADMKQLWKVQCVSPSGAVSCLLLLNLCVWIQHLLDQDSLGY